MAGAAIYRGRRLIVGVVGVAPHGRRDAPHAASNALLAINRLQGRSMTATFFELTNISLFSLRYNSMSSYVIASSLDISVFYYLSKFLYNFCDNFHRIKTKFAALDTEVN